jgi:hypothetical protein
MTLGSVNHARFGQSRSVRSITLASVNDGSVLSIELTCFCFRNTHVLFSALPYLTLPYLTLVYDIMTSRERMDPYTAEWIEQPTDIVMPYLTLPYLTLPYLTLPYLTLPYLTLPYLTLPYLT